MNKSEINEAVNKIREVVTGVSNNDIILALHSFDFNVEKTIQAFCEDGASGVLDDWVRPAGGGNKKNKNKKKKANETSTTTSTSLRSMIAPPATSVPSASPAPVTALAVKQESKAAPVSAPRVSKDPKPQPVSATSNGIQEAFQALRKAIAEREQVLLSSSTKDSVLVGDIPNLIAQIHSLTVRDSKQQPPKATPQKSVSPVQTGIKHATSQSSLSSSVGADSGVNLSPTHQDDKKPSKTAKVAQVASGGIQMSSDGLSEDQLAAIQRSLQESLAARGIDVSMLAGNGDMPVRKTQPRTNKPQERKGGQKNGGKTARPQLSILNNA